ncbi:MAG: hypothetical protein ABGW92_04505 [Methanocaldococcus sp.]
MIAFRDTYNYTEESIIKTAEFLKELKPDKCYLNTPIRPRLKSI